MALKILIVRHQILPKSREWSRSTKASSRRLASGLPKTTPTRKATSRMLGHTSQASPAATYLGKDLVAN